MHHINPSLRSVGACAGNCRPAKEVALHYKIRSMSPEAIVSQGELAEKDKELAAAGVEIEKLLQKIGDNTAVAEKEKAKVAVIVAQVTQQAQASLELHVSCNCRKQFYTLQMQFCFHTSPLKHPGRALSRLRLMGRTGLDVCQIGCCLVRHTGSNPKSYQSVSSTTQAWYVES